MSSTRCYMLACRTCTDPVCDCTCHLRNATPVSAPARSTVPASRRAGRLSEEGPGKPVFHFLPVMGHLRARASTVPTNDGPKVVRPHPHSEVSTPDEPGAGTTQKGRSDMRSAANRIVPMAVAS